MKKRVSSLENNKLLFYVVVVISFLNIVMFLSLEDWNSVAVFGLAGFIAYSFKVNKMVSLIIALVSANMFRASNKMQEGMGTGRHNKDKDEKDKKNDSPLTGSSVKTDKEKLDIPEIKPKLTSDNKPIVAPSDSETSMGKSKTSENATQVDGKPPETMKNFAALDSNSLEGLTSTAKGLMERQDQLQSLAKQLGPLMTQASKMMKQLPDGFLRDALKKKR